jgi:hypothetical protein
MVNIHFMGALLTALKNPFYGPVFDLVTSVTKFYSLKL